MRPISFLLLLSCFWAPGLGAQQTGQIDYPQLGLSFTIPDGWMGQELEGMYLMGHNSIPGYVFLVPHSQSLTVAQMKAEAQAGLALGAGSQLTPDGGLQDLGEGQVGGEFRGTVEFTPARAYLIGMENPHGNGLTIIAVTSTEAYQSEVYRKLARNIAAGVKFSAVAAAAAPPGTTRGTLADWQTQLSGTRLTFMESYYSGGSTGGGYSMNTEIHLCPAGYFRFYDQGFVSAGNANANAYSADSQRGDGSWEIAAEGSAFFLVLNFRDGSRKAFQLSWGEDRKLFLDGNRFYRTWEGEYAPNCG